jgi:hypothetical protein
MPGYKDTGLTRYTILLASAPKNGIEVILGRPGKDLKG